MAPPRRTGRRSLAAAVTALVILGGLGGTPGSVAPGAAEPLLGFGQESGVIRHVIVISIDGLRPDAIVRLGEAGAPALHRLMLEGAFTLNARTLTEQTITLPNHTGMVTGQRVDRVAGGTGVTVNTDSGGTVHDTAGRYVAGVFDVVHDNGGTTGLFVGKVKFDFLDRSWDAAHGAADTVAPDDGRDKIDRYVRSASASRLAALLAAGEAPTFSFLHLPQPDVAGHHHRWMSRRYLAAVTRADADVGLVLAAIDASAARSADTAVILTSDHGGRGDHHTTVRRPENYTVPFLVWGPGIEHGDLYAMNPVTRRDPGSDRPGYEGVQPIRNGEVANLALDLLGLPPVPGSLFDVRQDLEVRAD